MIHLSPDFPFEARFLIALVLTVAVETAVLLALIRLLYKAPIVSIGWARCIFAGFFASFATIPYLWFVLPAFIHSYTAMVVTGEIGAFLLEALAYVFLLNQPFRRTVVLSFVANLSSVVLGYIILS